MAKVELDLVKQVLKRAALDNAVVSKIVDALQTAVRREELDEEDEPKPAPIKKQHVILVADNNGILKEEECVGWILQMPEDEPMLTARDKIIRISNAFNTSKKGRRYPVETVGETCENVPSKFFKAQKLWLKTKEPVFLIPVHNNLDTLAEELLKEEKENTFNKELHEELEDEFEEDCMLSDEVNKLNEEEIQ